MGGAGGMNRPEIDVHRLDVQVVGRGAAGDVAEQGAERGGEGRRRRALAARSAAAKRPASRPIAALRHSPRTPVIWPAKRMCGAIFSRSVPSSSCGELMKVLRCSPPSRRTRPSPGRDGAEHLAPARRASAWSGSRPCSTACRAHCPGAAGRRHRASARSVIVGQADRLHRPVAQVSRPRSAITSIGRQPSK
jgi:hypothetical protein